MYFALQGCRSACKSGLSQREKVGLCEVEEEGSGLERAVLYTVGVGNSKLIFVQIRLLIGLFHLNCFRVNW